MTRFCALLALVVVMASGGYCATVVVSPDNMQGWDTAVNAGGTGSFATSGPVLDETAASFPSGRGAFYATCGFAGQGGGTQPVKKTPGTVWLGTDTNNGQSLVDVDLSRIKTMTYTAYASDWPVLLGGDGPLDWRYPREPISLQLLIWNGTDRNETRNLWFRAWPTGVNGYTAYGDLSNLLGHWITYDCVSCTFTGGSSATFASPGWCQPIDGETYHLFPTWADAMALFGNWKLVATAPVGDPAHSPGWDGKTLPTGNTKCTGTGMALNFEVGGRKDSASGIFNGGGSGWYKEGMGFRGYLDTFTLGVDYDGTEVVTTYDFEPAAAVKAPTTVATNIRSMCEGGVTIAGVPTSGHAGYSRIWSEENSPDIFSMFRTRVCGIVSNYSQTEYFREPGLWFKNFDISDGSPRIPSNVRTQVHCRDKGDVLDIQNGDFVAVTGYVRKLPWAWSKEVAPPADSQPWYVWCHAGSVTNYTWPPPPPP